MTSLTQTLTIKRPAKITYQPTDKLLEHKIEDSRQYLTKG